MKKRREGVYKKNLKKFKKFIEPKKDEKEEDKKNDTENGNK